MTTSTDTQPLPPATCSVGDLIEAQAESIRGCKQSIALANACADELRDRLCAAEAALAQVMRMDDAEDLMRLQRRLDRIQELRRMMETGSLVIEGNRAMDAAWKRLP